MAPTKISSNTSNSSSGTADKLLDSAQRMVQERGFNAFSYADLASEIGIRSASIHYHFKSKMDLGEALLRRYLDGLELRLDELDRLGSSKERLENLISDYRDTERRGFICLCGSLASDVETLPEAMQTLVQKYFARTESWVKQQIEDGIQSGELSPVAKADDLASMLISCLQGALLIDRARHKESMLDAVERTFFSALGT